jgi:hypothetical protein
MNKNGAYLKGKINTCINESGKGYQPTTNLVKDDNKNNLLSDSNGAINFCQLLSVQWDKYVGKTAKHTAEPLVSKPRHSATQMPTKKLTGYKSLRTA